MAETLESGSSREAMILNHPDPSVFRSGGRVEIDTSAPFESVREAASRFGGFGFWKPSLHRITVTSQEGEVEETDITKLEAHAAKIEKDLIEKERETFEVLKELEATKATVEELKSKLHHKEASEKKETLHEADKENNYGDDVQNQPVGVILVELNQAKVNLCRTTGDLSDIRASVELLNKKLEEEQTALERTRVRLAQKSLKVRSLEKEVNDSEARLRFAKNPKITEDFNENVSEISKEVQRLSREAEEFKRTGEAARLEIETAMAEMEDTRSKIKTAQIRLVAARKMKEAARAAEAVAFADIKAVTTSGTCKKADAVTISAEEYASLTLNAKEAEEKAKKRVEEAMRRAEANVSKKEIMKNVEEAAMEIKTSKRALEEALMRVEAANMAKFEAEEEFRKWRSENNGQRRRSSSVNNTVRFKNPCVSQQHRRESYSHLRDVNGLNLTTHEGLSSSSVPVLRHTMSIGEILSRKLLLAEESDMEVDGEKGRISGRRRVSLGQMLGKSNTGDVGKENGKRLNGKRKKLGFAKFTVLLNRETNKKMKMKKKKFDLNLR